eukprot:1663318-Rhodomonas_salina.1
MLMCGRLASMSVRRRMMRRRSFEADESTASMSAVLESTASSTTDIGTTASGSTGLHVCGTNAQYQRAIMVVWSEGGSSTHRLPSMSVRQMMMINVPSRSPM